MKAIFAKEVRAGDHIVFNASGKSYHVADVIDGEINYPDHVVIIVDARGCSEDELPIPIDDNRILGLIHRPWPVGETEKSMFDRINRLMSSCTSVLRIGQAIEAYELGLPQEEK